MEVKEVDLAGKRLLSVEQEANFLGLSPRSIYKGLNNAT